MKGKLFVVATPIGNLGDISQRAIDTLKNVIYILCEDTRVSKVICDKMEIGTTLVSYRDQNHLKMIEKIIEKLNMGLDIALISDAGTPTISDPGYKLISELKKLDYPIIPIPGPDATTALLSVSGLPTDRYIFLGFLPKSDSKIAQMLKTYGNIDCTVCIYESPNRLKDLLTKILETLGDRTVCIGNDLTKFYEKVETNLVSKLLEESELVKNPKGEFVVLIGKE
jgi:16S rRNA (cytidine1402-2'-O)-methyltransferase